MGSNNIVSNDDIRTGGRALSRLYILLPASWNKKHAQIVTTKPRAYFTSCAQVSRISYMIVSLYMYIVRHVTPAGNYTHILFNTPLCKNRI